jgi:ubiquinone/menaquinone biosynthesis C-methylase UbiE
MTGSYKEVWNGLAATFRNAVIHVQGDASEAELQATGEATVEDLKATVGVRPDDVVLEIGCGIGRVGKVLAPLCKAWIGCDVSGKMLAHAKSRLKELNNVRLVETSGVDLAPIQDQSVDLAYCTVVFMHLDEWDRYSYVLEAKRILRPGGRIFVDSFNLCHDRGWRLFESLRTTYRPAQRPAHISRSSTPAEIETYLTRAGFQSVQLRLKDEWIQGWAVRP